MCNKCLINNYSGLVVVRKAITGDDSLTRNVCVRFFK